MITIYDSFGIPHQVTLAEYIALEAAELAKLLEMSQHDAVQ